MAVAKTTASDHAGIGSKFIPAPFPKVAAHVKGPQFVGRELPHLMNSKSAVFNIPAYLVQIVAAAVRAAIGVQTAPGREFPFRVAGQPVTYLSHI